MRPIVRMYYNVIYNIIYMYTNVLYIYNIMYINVLRSISQSTDRTMVA